MEIRPAISTDASDICTLVRASITSLCVGDHLDSADLLMPWLSNKTPANVAKWLSNPNNINLVVVEGGAILGAGCVTLAGEIVLNYVSPAARFRGVSKALLSGLEASARDAGNLYCKLDSTSTAHRFYQERGYRDVRPGAKKHGLVVYPMVKAL